MSENIDDGTDYGQQEQHFFIGANDWANMQHLNREFIEDIQRDEILFYAINEDHTETNVYGETKDGDQRYVYPPISMKVMLDIDDQESTKQMASGSSNMQSMTVYFQREMLRRLDLYPEPGDIFQWSNLYFEIKSYADNDLIGTKTQLRHSMSVKAVQTRLSNINIVQDQPPESEGI